MPWAYQLQRQHAFQILDILRGRGGARGQRHPAYDSLSVYHRLPSNSNIWAPVRFERFSRQPLSTSCRECRLTRMRRAVCAFSACPLPSPYVRAITTTQLKYCSTCLRGRALLEAPCGCATAPTYGYGYGRQYCSIRRPLRCNLPICGVAYESYCMYETKSATAHGPARLVVPTYKLRYVRSDRTRCSQFTIKHFEYRVRRPRCGQDPTLERSFCLFLVLKRPRRCSVQCLLVLLGGMSLLGGDDLRGHGGARSGIISMAICYIAHVCT